MTDIAQQATINESIAAAFEHSITWEDDIWRADPVDVEEVHHDARAKFFSLLQAIAGRKPTTAPARILLFHGQSGAGKTHLIRALRTAAHSRRLAYFGYAQMTPDVSSYADYFLRRLVTSLDKPYDPHAETSETGLERMTRRLCEAAKSVGSDALEALRDGEFDDTTLARLIHAIADEIIAAPGHAAHELDANIVRALLYLQRRDPKIDQRVRQYLCGRELSELSRSSVAALDPNTGDDRAFEIIEGLGTIMSAVDGAALVFCIDQVEDLRFFADAEDRFQRAVRDLIQIANRLPTAIVVISCLEDFYGHVRGVVAQSYIDRIEKSGPVALLEARTPEEARLIISKRIQRELVAQGQTELAADPVRFFGPGFLEEFGGLSTRKLLEHAQARLREGWLSGSRRDGVPKPPPLPVSAASTASSPVESPAASLISTLAAALGFGGDAPAPADAPAFDDTSPQIDYRTLWDRFVAENEVEATSDDDALLELLGSSLKLVALEWSDRIRADVAPAKVDDELPAIDVTVEHRHTGHAFKSRIFLCNKPTQGGGLKRQLDRIVQSMDARTTSFLLRAGEFPTGGKNQTAQAVRKFREAGGRQLIVPNREWEGMMMVREFHVHYRNDPGFGGWFSSAKLVSQMPAIEQILRLELIGEPLPWAKPRLQREQAVAVIAQPEFIPSATAGLPPTTPAATTPFDSLSQAAGSDWIGWASTYAPGAAMPYPPVTGDAGGEPEPAETPLADLLESEERDPSSILVGNVKGDQRRVTMPKSVMKRHCAVLGGSGSGKTTLALTIIEQLLLQGIPAVLIDRKGDLCSYANPEVWREICDDETERGFERERLADAIDVAVYTPGRASGRPISITLLPSGINELPEHEQQLLANLGAAALGDMLHLKNSATHQKQSGTLSVALRILGARSSREVMLADLIDLLEEEDPELTELTQRMDPSGRLRRDLVAQLDSLRHRNAALFEGGGESLRMDQLLGLGPNKRDGRTRLSIIYTGFLGDNENILFWVAQFLSEALRFCQRNPNDELQAVVMFDEADLYIPANAKPATAEPLQSLLKRARSAGLGLMLATQSPGDLDYKSRDQITSWFIGRVREDTALRKLKAAFQSESGLDAANVLPAQTVGEFHLVQEGLVRPMKARRSLIQAEQVPFDRIEYLAAETRGHDQTQLPLFGAK